MQLLNRIKNYVHSRSQRILKQTKIDKNIYLVYSMGKVGSSTIYNSLKAAKPYSEVHHVHFLSKNYLENILPDKHKNFHNNIEIGKNILKLIENRPKSRLKIITLTREPIDRSISNLFQNWQHIYNDIEEVSTEELMAHIESLNHYYTLNWFDWEFKEYLGFDIYKENFDKEKGYGIYKNKNIDILCIKLEKLNSVSDIAFKEFLGVNIPIIERNKSIVKKGKDHYKFLKANLKLDKEYLANLYTSKYVEHFYSKEEIDFFIQKWGKNTQDSFRND